MRLRTVTGGVITLAVLGGVTWQAMAQRQAPPVTAEADEALLRWPLPPGAAAYGDIDGKHLHRFVVEQAGISRRYRDQGHPKFWGRIIGSSADAESAAWLVEKFKAIGLSDVRIQPIDLEPQWMPRSWSMTVTSGGKTLTLESAQPDYGANPTPAAGLDLEAVYAGLGSEADFAGKDVRGKAVFVFNMVGLKPEGAVKRADDKGAAAIVEVDMLPGNMRYQAYPSGTKAPAFTVGGDDGFAARDLIATTSVPPSATSVPPVPTSVPPGAISGTPGQRGTEVGPGGTEVARGGTEVGRVGGVRVHVALDAERVSNLKSALVWGTLPGATDETIYIMAHRDGWFDASGDNAGGVATMIGLAEHFAKIPQAQRKRTIVFIGLDGHHNSGQGAAAGGRWLGDHRDALFAKTALAINCEHPSTVQTYVRPRYEEGRDLVWANTFMAQQWYAGGPSRPELREIAVKAFREFGAPMYREPNVRPPLGDLGRVYRFVPGVATSEFYHYFHTDRETPETVPWTGLEAMTRAYARIVDEVNKLPLSALQRPMEQ